MRGGGSGQGRIKDKQRHACRKPRRTRNTREESTCCEKVSGCKGLEESWLKWV
jgi:hypothetical protein